MISLAQVQHHVGDGLRTVHGKPPRALSITGVHISELDDPTPYLEGGELLLTTGIPVRGSVERTRGYLRRLAGRGVAALGLGLGAGLDRVPDDLQQTCEEYGVELLLVPDGVPFMDISRAYWDLVAKLGQSDLVASLGTQTALARAATRTDALNSVVKALAQALGGWAAYLPADGGLATHWPPSASPLLPQLRQETARLNMSGLHSAATFQVHGADVVEHPVLVGQRMVGVLAIGAGRTLTRADRQIIQTVCMLLSLKAQQAQEAEERSELLQAAVARLVLSGHLEAAQLLAQDLGLSLPAARVRLVLLAGLPEGLGHREVEARLATLRGAERLTGTVVSRCRDGVVDVLFLDPERSAEVPRTTPERGSDAVAAATQDIGGAGGLAVGARGVLGPAVPLGQLPEQLAQLRVFLDAVPDGEIRMPPVNPLDPQASVWVQALREHDRADLLGTVRAYLRHRGHWESAARELGIHRNSLRHRMSVATRLMEVDPDDPDVAANLWLALRRP
ncbi:PucR family transcriptional regulator [Arthrobacter sp. NPDC090010]|uniref:PucR family transcriptional regulator n=1 Tax=Arthrobacter sp. NPDC090010 TaxID=3363942 RepID=UPI00381D4894